MIKTELQRNIKETVADIIEHGYQDGQDGLKEPTDYCHAYAETQRSTIYKLFLDYQKHQDKERVKAMQRARLLFAQKRNDAERVGDYGLEHTFENQIAGLDIAIAILTKDNSSQEVNCGCHCHHTPQYIGQPGYGMAPNWAECSRNCDMSCKHCSQQDS